MLAQPLISVVIPSYKHGHLIGRTLQSVLNQTYDTWEAIVVDNQSPDDTDQIVGGFADPRIKLLKIKNYGVIAASRNMGIRAAKGEWIAFLDSDDWWTTNKLQECVEHIRDNVDLIYHDLEIVRDRRSFFGAKRIKSRRLREPILLDLLVSGNAIANSSVVVRKSALSQIGGLSEDRAMIAAEDYYAWLKLAQLEKKFCYIPLTLGHYYLNSFGMSKIDMSVPTKQAVSEFRSSLDLKESLVVESRLNYTSGRFNFLLGFNDKAGKSLLFSLRHGTFEIKVKSAIMLFNIYIMR